MWTLTGLSHTVILRRTCRSWCFILPKNTDTSNDPQAQYDILSELGCQPGWLGYVDGGIDTAMAQNMIAHQCGVELPRYDERFIGGAAQFVSLLDECGGHGGRLNYHFHELCDKGQRRGGCLSDKEHNFLTAKGHSPPIAEETRERVDSSQKIYGKWEKYSETVRDLNNNFVLELPQLDACGGHFGFTPDTHYQYSYHYHVQENPPFVLGCYGPGSAHDDASGQEVPALVSTAMCRSLYPSLCNDDDATTLTARGWFEDQQAFMPTAIRYDQDCPCFDAAGMNTGPITEHPAVIHDNNKRTTTTTTTTTTTSTFTTSTFTFTSTTRTYTTTTTAPPAKLCILPVGDGITQVGISTKPRGTRFPDAGLVKEHV